MRNSPNGGACFCFYDGFLSRVCRWPWRGRPRCPPSSTRAREWWRRDRVEVSCNPWPIEGISSKYRDRLSCPCRRAGWTHTTQVHTRTKAHKSTKGHKSTAPGGARPDYRWPSPSARARPAAKSSARERRRRTERSANNPFMMEGFLQSAARCFGKGAQKRQGARVGSVPRTRAQLGPKAPATRARRRLGGCRGPAG